MQSVRFRIAAAGLLLFSLPALYAAKPAPADYQDAVLISFTTVATGTNCTTDTDTSARSTSGSTAVAHSDGTVNCADRKVRRYVIKLGEHQYIVESTASAWRSAPLVVVVPKKDALAAAIPGTHVLLRSASGGFRIRFDKEETSYRIVEAN